MTKKADLWMPLLVDKYLGDTTHLNTEQHGAYLLLLMSMWKRGGRLPNDDTQLSSIAKLQPARWRAYKAVLLDFFKVDADGFLVQKRLSAELERANANIDQRSAAGKASAAARAAQRVGQRDADETSNETANEISTAVATDVATDGQRTVQQTGKPIPIPSSSLRSEDPPKPPEGGEPDLLGSLVVVAPKPKRQRKPPPVITNELRDLFDQWYAAYPRKEAKTKAFEAFVALAPNPEKVQSWIVAISAQGLIDRAKRGEGRYIPLPATWLNGERWNDEVPAAGKGELSLIFARGAA